MQFLAWRAAKKGFVFFQPTGWGTFKMARLGLLVFGNTKFPRGVGPIPME